MQREEQVIALEPVAAAAAESPASEPAAASAELPASEPEALAESPASEPIESGDQACLSQLGAMHLLSLSKVLFVAAEGSPPRSQQFNLVCGHPRFELLN